MLLPNSVLCLMQWIFTLYLSSAWLYYQLFTIACERAWHTIIPDGQLINTIQYNNDPFWVFEEDERWMAKFAKGFQC